jgi:hypothetical protein
MQNLTGGAVTVLGVERLLATNLKSNPAAVATTLIPGVEVVVLPVDLVRWPLLPFFKLPTVLLQVLMSLHTSVMRKSG